MENATNTSAEPEEHFQPSRRRSIKELLQLPGKDCGHIEGKVFMVWPPRKGVRRVYLEVQEDSTVYRLEVVVPYREEFAFRPHDRIQLGLKGMTIEQQGQSNAPYALPIALKYPDGVLVKFLSGRSEGMVIDTWQNLCYKPGTADPISRGEIRSAKSLGGVSVEDNRVGVTALTETAAKKAMGIEAAAKEDSVDSIAQPNQQLEKDDETLIRNKQERACGREQTANSERRSGSNRAVHRGEFVSPREMIDPCSKNHPDNQAGGRNPERGGLYTALSGLQKSSAFVNVVGVVTAITPEKKTRTNEWSCSFTIVDSSTFNSPSGGIRVNCFQKEYAQWLPQVALGDVVILHGLKMVEFNGVLRATGFGDRLRWAVYDTAGCRIRPPIKGDAPEKVINGFTGYGFSPYLETSENGIEVQYCLQVVEWWKAMQAMGTRSLSSAQRHPPAQKKHLLISDASPNRAPKGFFNCTVEILRKFENDGGPTVVYVTDYTTNSDLPPVQDAWCPPGLSNGVLHCDMWDAAKSVARAMKPGEYWYLHNVRAKWNHRNSIEATMQLAEKITRLDETVMGSQPYLKALIAKEVFGKRAPASPTGDALVCSTTNPASIKLYGGSGRGQVGFGAGLTDVMHDETEDARACLTALRDDITIREALLRPAPDQFKILARAADYYPFSLEDSAALRCTACGRALAPECPECRWAYCFYLQLNDEEGGELMVSLSGKECNVLKGVEPANFRKDQGSFYTFLQKVRPILGNLEEVHKAWSKEEEMKVEAPLMAFTVESWMVEGEKAYGLLDCCAV